MKTLTEILSELHAAGVNVSHRTLIRDIARLGILACGVRQRPQRYPAYTASRVAAARGVFKDLAKQPAESLPTLKQLRAKKGGAK